MLAKYGLVDKFVQTFFRKLSQPDLKFCNGTNIDSSQEKDPCDKDK